MDKKPNPNSMRVLIRPPATPQPSPSSSSSSSTTPPSGVVVVGFIGRRHGDVSQVINRILDSNVFGSGRADSPLGISLENQHLLLTDQLKHWFNNRRISYHLDELKNLLFLQMSSTTCPAMRSLSGVDSLLDDQYFGDLQGMLFMFTVNSFFPLFLSELNLLIRLYRNLFYKGLERIGSTYSLS